MQSARFRKGRIYLIQMDVFLNYLRSHHQWWITINYHRQERNAKNSPQKSKIFQCPCFAFVEKREIRSPLICLGPYFPSSSSSSSFDKNLNQTNFRSSSSIFFFSSSIWMILKIRTKISFFVWMGHFLFRVTGEHEE